MKKIAIFGSAFNPPSYGHLSVIERLAHFDQVLLVPSIAHAWGKEMLDYSLRCSMIEAFVDDIPCNNVSLSRIEERVEKLDTGVTTYQVLEEIQAEYPSSELTFVMGPDNLFNFAKFYNAEKIMKRWNVLACPETVAIRSTEIREKLAQGQEINSLTTKSVVKILQNKHLYRII
ncbi:nicotinate-nicotinamide nucleotide adenylyltransferase [Vibrio sp. UCD-FRSSP16_10]|uniref:nicotinate-nicotinamide nucleotide adenylyltransferase n=1 Tax=unclassified Vibrio TaxID=2614977 RepID=UPI0008021511|nr:MULTISPECIES: nicotinate-nicotinamide nucleotide adenylyltransferase [unclassified Vibrio]OBT07924.1 nicotinate-nicotinamide nucleotide adenylyltransferase [Vibrio sp. UCD-FRSSP16_30]OBT17099.1 nicotinate-nicotinamide nucleotide adenylyltransferase [Vibrio sp. UCD-FRSSP16_10]